MEIANKLNERVLNVKTSTLYRFFDLAKSIEGVISLGVGEPDFETPWHIREEAIYTIEKAKTYYAPNQGLAELREEICKYYERKFGCKYDKEDCIITVGGSEGIDVVFRTLLNPDDEVIVLTPGYIAYEPCITLAGGKPVIIELKEENHFKLKKEDLVKAITSKTKAILINFPGNPTGGVMNKSDYEEIIPVIKESGVFVVSDEIYAELTYNSKHVSIASFEEIKDQVIVINGFSKAYSMTGWRLGYILCSNKISQYVNKVHSYCTMSANTIAQYAGVEAVRNGDSDIERMKDSFLQRRNFLVNSLNKIGLKCHFPEGAFYVFPSIKATGLSSDEFCERLLKEYKVAVVPGTAFGKEGEGYIRISYAYSIEQLKIAIEKMAEFMKILEAEKK